MEEHLLRAHTCCFTGHRVIARADRETLPALLERAIRALLACGVFRFVAGGALGFDTLAAETALSLREEFSSLHLTVIAPYLGQPDGWSGDDRARYERIRSAADEYISLESGYTRGCMRRRNHEMVDRSAVCLAYLLRRGSGTSQTVDYAVQSGLEVINLAELLQNGLEFPVLRER